jgi:hypothetical protein
MCTPREYINDHDLARKRGYAHANDNTMKGPCRTFALFVCPALAMSICREKNSCWNMECIA